MDAPPDNPGSSLWPLTDWSGVGHAAESVGKDAEKLNSLITNYQRPLRRHLVCSFPALEQRADELLQDYAQDKILKEGWLAKASRERGRFRQFLKTSLANYVKDRLAAEGQPHLSLDEFQKEVPAEEKASEEFDLNWVRTIEADVLARMEKECKRANDQPRRAQTWEIFRLRLLLPILEGTEPPVYGELVTRLGIASLADAQNMLATAKRIFARHWAKVVREYEGGGAAARAEIEELKRSLSRISDREKR